MLGMKGGNRSAYWYTSKRLGRSMEIEEHKITPDSSLIGGRNDRFEEQKNIHKSSNDKTDNLSMDTGKNAILNADFKGRKSEKQIEKRIFCLCRNIRPAQMHLPCGTRLI